MRHQVLVHMHWLLLVMAQIGEEGGLGVSLVMHKEENLRECALLLYNLPEASFPQPSDLPLSPEFELKL